MERNIEFKDKKVVRHSILDRDIFLDNFDKATKNGAVDKKRALDTIQYIEEDELWSQQEQSGLITFDELEKIPDFLRSALEKVDLSEGDRQNKLGLIDFIQDTIKDIVDKCNYYYDAVLKMERQSDQASKGFLREERFVDIIQDVDNHRHLVHNALIVDLTIFRRTVGQLGLKVSQLGIFSSSQIEDRHFVASWALLNVVLRKFQTAKIKAERILSEENNLAHTA